MTTRVLEITIPHPTQVIGGLQTPKSSSSILQVKATSTRRPRLPTETCEHIIDFCAYDSWLYCRPQTLRACALTCRAWLPRSRFHLYRGISLCNASHYHNFLSTVKANPLLSTFVHELDLGEPVTLDDEKVIVTTTTTVPIEDIPTKKTLQLTGSYHNNWILGVIIHLLPLLPVLCDIRFCCLPTFCGKTLVQLSQLRRHKTITSLSLHSCSFGSARDLVRFLSWFPFMESLHVRNVHVAKDIRNFLLLAGGHYHRLIPTPKTLQLCKILDLQVIQNLLSLRTIKATRELQFVCDHMAMIPALSHALRVCTVSLESFELVLEDIGAAGAAQIGCPGHIDLSCASQLLAVRICARVVRGADRLFDALILPPQIETLTLSFLLHEDSVALLSSLSWDSFDVYLAQVRFAKLAQIRVIVHEAAVSVKDRLILRKCLGSQFQKLGSKGVMVSVDYRTHEISSILTVWQ